MHFYILVLFVIQTVKLPLTWGQVEAFGGIPAEGKVLEVRILVVDYFGPRQILQCKGTESKQFSIVPNGIWCQIGGHM